jgi:ribosome-associated translation inhibitor RaiA
MRLRIHASKHVRVTSRLREHIARRAYFCLSRFGERVSEVAIGLSDENGPKRGVDRVCRVVTTIKGAAPLVVEDRDTRVKTAVDHALRRTERYVARVLRRMPRGSRQPLKSWPLGGVG